MDEKKKRIAANREKLKQRTKGSQLGGKGTMRRKRKHKSKGGNTDSKLNTMFKKFGAETIPEIAEVNMFTDDDRVLSFKNPQVRGSIQNQTLIVTGTPEDRALADCFTEIMPQLGPQQQAKIKGLIAQNPPKEAKTEEKKGDDSDSEEETPVNFEEVSEQK